ncbi:MAG TPA: Gfo/Idh/MocA family oxidoreductase [Chloroflexota bacterium]
MAPLKVGLIGAGYMMQNVHLPSLRAIGDAEPVAIADLDAELAATVARAFGIPRVYGRAEELVAGEAELDAVVVVTNKLHHAAACLPALERGLPVLIEKPLEASLEAARRMVATAERTGATLMVGYMKRYDPAFRELERRLADGALGELRYARIHDFGGNWTAGAPRVGALRLDEAESRPGPNRRPAAAPADAQTAAFNEWIEVWIHDVNMARALFGEPRSILFATNERPRLALVEFERARVMLEMGGIAYQGAAWDERLTLYGREGIAELVFPAPLLFRKATELVLRDAGGESRPAVPDGEAFTEELIYFLRCVRSGEPVMTSGRDALRDLELCARIVEKATEGDRRR